MKNILHSYIAFLCLLVPNIASSQDEQFPYVNEEGEEIFGEDYRPKNPDTISLPYWIGRPNAGVVVPDSLMVMPQDSFRVSPDFLSVPDLGRRLPFESFAPLRQRFESEQFERLQPDFQFDGAERVLPREILQLDDAALNSTMRAHFVDVGQGDGAILEFPCGVAVIDLGGEYRTQTKGGRLFVEYLSAFFADRPHLGNKIDVIFVTHPHADHIAGMSEFFNNDGTPKFEVGSIVDNGQSGTSGSLGKQTDFRQRLVDAGASYTAVQLARQVTATGVTNNGIDPIRCDNIDPIITVFWGGVDEQDTLEGPYGNPNNHSVVIRVDFGSSSFLFTGDLEDKGEADLRAEFQQNLSVFDVDVYQVSHHGADDDTSDAFLEIISPKIAVISMGRNGEGIHHTSWDHGHPRTGLLEVLQEDPSVVSEFRPLPTQHLAYSGQETDPELILIERAIYGTGWSGHVVIEATGSGSYSVLSGEP